MVWWHTSEEKKCNLNSFVMEFSVVQYMLLIGYCICRNFASKLFNEFGQLLCLQWASIHIIG